MAKKKVSHSHQEKPLPKPEAYVEPHQQVNAAAMDSEASEKLENLKSLNQILIKESFERRQQVESLIQSNGYIESELTRANSERNALRSELTQLGEKAARLELERSVVDVFVAVQMSQNGEVIGREMKGLEMEVRELKGVIDGNDCEIGKLSGKLMEIESVLENEREVSSRAFKETDELKGRLEVEIVEGKGSREKLIEFEERKREMEREIGELRVAYDCVVRDKEDRETKIESMMGEKVLMERGLVELNKLVDKTKEELCAVLREKEGIEEEKNMETVKRHELENGVGKLNEIVVSLQKEEDKLRANVAELEKKCLEGEEKQKDMGREIDELVGENKLSDKRFDVLIDNKNVIEENLKKALKQLDEDRHKMEGLVNEKTVLLESKGRLGFEISSLQNQLAELKSGILKLEESSRVEVEKIKSLESEVGDYKSKLEQVKFERDEIKNSLGEEKQNVVRLNEHIQDMEKKIEESIRVANEVNAENDEISIQKIELEDQCEKLKKEVTSLEVKLIEAQNEFDSLKGKVELADANSEVVMNMLKDTSTFCSKDEKDLTVYGEETKPYVIEFETINKAFRSKETKVENMKKQLELLQSSVEEAQKKKSFWTLLSSATTLMAAFSLAYVARGH